MENVKIILENGLESVVSGLFYKYDSKFYFMYTLGEIVDAEYVQLYIVQIFKEENSNNGQNTPSIIGIDISNQNDWAKVQEVITKIVSDKKNGVQSNDIQYLQASMLDNLKIINKNKFKLTKHIVEENFNLSLNQSNESIMQTNQNIQPEQNKSTVEVQEPQQIQQPVSIEQPVQMGQQNNVSIESSTPTYENVSPVSNEVETDVIVDYRASFFQEQEKNIQLEEEIKKLQDKLNSIKEILG